MTWQILWALILGFTLSAVVQAVVRRATVVRLLSDALRHADQGIAGSMEGHAAMEMAVDGDGPFWRRLTSARGYTAVSHIFVMEWAAVWRDIAGGLLITGALAAWVPAGFWRG